MYVIQNAINFLYLVTFALLSDRAILGVACILFFDSSSQYCSDGIYHVIPTFGLVTLVQSFYQVDVTRDRETRNQHSIHGLDEGEQKNAPIDGSPGSTGNIGKGFRITASHYRN